MHRNVSKQPAERLFNDQQKQMNLIFVCLFVSVLEGKKETFDMEVFLERLGLMLQ